MKDEVLAEPILVGREHELTELKHYLNLATEGKGNTIFISGEAGTGKTRFVKEFLSFVIHNREATTLIGWCLSNATLPYFPFIEAFNAYFAQRKSEENESKQIENEESETKAWLMGLKQTQKSGKFGNLSPQAMKDMAFVVIAKALLSISAKKLTILFIDDLHWADSASLALLHYISRAITAERVLVLATFRSEELSPDVGGHPHPLVETLRLMRREDLFKEIKLQNLNQIDVSAIAENILGGSLAPDFEIKLSEESKGNPLFIIESLRMLSEQGTLIRECDQWVLSVDELGIPTKIRDIILRRLSTLNPNQRKVLDLASVIGEKFNVDLLGAVLGQDNLDVLEMLNSVEQSSSLVVCEGDSYMFDHEKSREALYEEISLPLRRGYHARIAEKIENARKSLKEISFSDLAYHYAQAGNKEKSVKYALEAGKEALSRFSNPEAIKHFKYVIQTIGKIQGYFEERKVALEGLGDAYHANSMNEEAAKIFEILASSATGAVKLRAYRKEMDAVWYSEYGNSRLMQLVKEAEKYVASDRLEMARILRYKGAALLRLGNLKESLKYHEEALKICKEEYSLPDVAELLSVTGGIRILCGFQHEGLGELQRSIALYQELGNIRKEIEAARYRNMFLGIVGPAPELESQYTYVLEMGKKIGDFETLASTNLIMSYRLEVRGLFKKAIVRSLKALDYSQKTDTKRLQGEIYAVLLRLYARIGDLRQANHYFKILMKIPSRIRVNPRNAFVIAIAEAVRFAVKSQWKEANQRFLKAFEMSKMEFWRYFRISEFLGRDYFVWALDLQGRIEEAEIQREETRKNREKNRERFAHANLQTDLIMRSRVVAKEEIEMRLDLVNVGRGSASIIKIQDLIPSDGFKVTALPSYCHLQDGDLEMGNREVNAFQVDTIKLNVKAIKAGIFDLSPQITYIDDLRKVRICKINSINITVQQAKPSFKVLPGRITTGFVDLDRLLLGGIPENYAIVLIGSPCDEREMIVKNFLESGTKEEETTFYIATEAVGLENLLEDPNFHLFLCNPKSKIQVPDQPNITKLRSKTDLNNLNMALTKTSRNMAQTQGTKRICIDIISDVLLRNGPEVTRRWLSELITDLGSKGFIILAVMDPEMHPSDQSKAVLNLFDGEISITQTEDLLEYKKSIQVKKLRGQDYIKNSICITIQK